MEDHADRQSGFDRDVRVRTLAAGLAAGRSPPGIECLIRQPDGHVATTPKAGLVLRPIPYPILRLRVLVLASLRILHRWRLRVRGFSFQRNLDQEPCTNASINPGPITPPSGCCAACSPRTCSSSIHVEYLFMWSRMRDGA